MHLYSFLAVCIAIRPTGSHGGWDVVNVCHPHVTDINTHPPMQDTLSVDLLREGHKPGCHGNKSRTLKGLSDAVALTTMHTCTCVIVTSMSMNTTSLECGDAVCTSSRMQCISCIQRNQVLLVIYSASCVNHLLFAEHHRWHLNGRALAWWMVLADWVWVWHECENLNMSKYLFWLMLRLLAAVLGYFGSVKHGL